MSRRRGRWRRSAAGALVVALAACRRDPPDEPRPRGTAGASDAAGTPTAAAADGAPPGVAASRFPAPERPVSRIISPRWSDEDARDDAGEADTVLALLGVGPGTAVADVGAGDGYYTVRAARRVRPGGRVYAEDITPRYVTLLRDRLRRDRVADVVVVLGEPHDPRLPRAAVDVALLVHMYHEIEQPYALLHNLAPALRPGGRVAILDLDRPTGQHGTPPRLLACELAHAGYRPLTRHPLGPGEYLAVFTPPAPGTVTPEQITAAVRAAPCRA